MSYTAEDMRDIFRAGRLAAYVEAISHNNDPGDGGPSQLQWVTIRQMARQLLEGRDELPLLWVSGGWVSEGQIDPNKKKVEA